MLAVQRLTKHYGALASIQDVSFEAGPGKVHGLIGPNGPEEPRASREAPSGIERRVFRVYTTPEEWT
jgi:hypothetical protein